ncbi:MAG: CDP-alcohol phosphatidyltransferase family protein [Planctomycetota bacterium]
MLSAFRIVLAATFPFAPSRWRLAFVLGAGLSDGLDGFIARRYHATSALGGLLDGIADKLFVLAAVITFAFRDPVLFPWWHGLLVMARDFSVAGMAVYAATLREWSSFKRMRPRLPGKITTALIFPWFVSLLVDWAEPLRLPLFLACAICSVLAAADYFGQLVHELGARKRARLSS